MPLKYNPLLKIGLENTGNGSGDVDEKIAALQNAVNALQESLNALKNRKITKVTASSQLAELTDGEIFEWQAASTADFTQGYFYKKNGNNYPRVDLQPNYSLPIAAANLLGGVKVGSGLNIDGSGVLSVTGGDGLKVPRCFTDAQIAALTDGDIFEWQGETTADYTQGYFYKKTSNTTVLIESGATYLNNTFGPYIRGNYSVQNGYYKFIEETNDIDNGYFINKNSDSTRFYCSLMPAVVGQVAIVTTEAHVGGDFIEFVTVTAVNSYGYPTEYSDGVSVSFSSNPNYKNSKICKYQNVKTNDIVYFPVYPNGGYPFAFFVLILDNGVYYPIGRLTANVYVATTDITETTIITSRVDTQPQPPIATANQLGLIKVGANIAINANGVLSGNYQNATPSAAGLMSASDKNKVDTIGIVYRGHLQHNIQVMTSGSNLIHVYCQDFENDNICLDCYIAARGTLGSSSTFTWHYVFNIIDNTKLDIQCNFNGVINVINKTGRADSDFILFIDKLI